MEYLDSGGVSDFSENGPDVQVGGAGVDFSSERSANDAEFRLDGFVATDVVAVEVMLDDGQTYPGVVGDSWFIVSSGPIDIDGNELIEQVSLRGSATVRWTYNDGRTESGTVAELDPNRIAYVEPELFSQDSLDALPIFARDETAADRDLPVWMSPFDGPALAEHVPDLTTTRRGAELDGITVWIAQSTPRGFLCVYHHEQLSSGGGCQGAISDDQPQLICAAWSDSINSSYLYGFVLDGEVPARQGVVEADGTFIVKLSDTQISQTTIAAELANFGC